MYDGGWERYRIRFLRVNPECYACAKKSVVVDHLVPHQGDERLFKKLDNHIPLCISCHNTVTAKFDRNYVAGSPITEKIKWLNQNRMPGDGGNPRRVKVLSSYE
jgi:5-methylcytosine-specific restriction endonuclease McrA